MAPKGFNENHKRRLRTTFQHLDEVLTEVVQLLGPSRAQSPFNKHVPDASPVQHRVIQDYAARAREAMRKILEGNDVLLPPPQISAVWAARTDLMMARVSVEELAPGSMRGYGELSAEAQRELELIAATLDDLLNRMESYLAQGAARDLHARLERLTGTQNELSLLRELERVITAHGLIEFRPTLDMLIERMEGERFEIALFGRVSSGKSSLLDYLLQTDILPVGVTPVTAVPIRIAYGAQPRAIVWTAEAKPLVIDPQRLAEFASEQQNPSNAKHVTRIQVELPAERLKQAVTFADTPGLGSLATSGAAESLAYLPRCDLGIVLVDASSTIVPEDIAVVDMLYRSGARAMVLLSKADVLQEEERQRASDYALQQLQENLRQEVPVYAVSVRGEAKALCNHWIDVGLTPALNEHRRFADESRRRKIGALREAVTAAMKRKLSPGKSAVTRPSGESARAVERVIAEALAALDSTARQFLDPSSAGAANGTLDEVARSMATRWREDHASKIDMAGFCQTLLTARGAQIASTVARHLQEIRAALMERLRQIGCEHVDDAEHLPRPANMPVLDTGTITSNLRVRKPTLSLFGSAVLTHRIRSQLTAIEPDVQQLLEKYVKLLENWRAAYLRELRRAFIAKAEWHTGMSADSLELSQAASEDRESLVADLAAIERCG